MGTRQVSIRADEGLFLGLAKQNIWNIIFDELNSKYRPPEKIRETTEAGLRDKWKSMLQNTNPDDEITSEQSVWPSGTRIDVYRKSAIDHSIIIYEQKA